MHNPFLSILVVDDARFSSSVIGRTLTRAGYQDIRFAASAHEALEQLEQRPANLILADWMMPEVDGLELTARIRRQDERSDHYSYVILLTGREGEGALVHAFEHGVDDFIAKNVMSEQLLPRVLAADRLCGTLQRLTEEKQHLQAGLTDLAQRDQIDPLTGLGNGRHLEEKLDEGLRHVESRDSSLCLLMVGLAQVETLRRDLGQAGYDELQRNIARRLRQLVRPLDLLFRLDDTRFALLCLINDASSCVPSSFKRLHDSLNLKAFKTRDGFVNLKAGIVLLGIEQHLLPNSAGQLIASADKLLPMALSAGRIVPLRPGTASPH